MRKLSMFILVIGTLLISGCTKEVDIDSINEELEQKLQLDIIDVEVIEKSKVKDNKQTIELLIIATHSDYVIKEATGVFDYVYVDDGWVLASKDGLNDWFYLKSKSFIESSMFEESVIKDLAETATEIKYKSQIGNEGIIIPTANNLRVVNASLYEYEDLLESYKIDVEVFNEQSVVKAELILDYQFIKDSFQLTKVEQNEIGELEWGSDLEIEVDITTSRLFEQMKASIQPLSYALFRGELIKNDEVAPLE